MIFATSFVDGILAPLLSLPQLLVLILVTFSLSLFMTLLYKKLTDQTMMRMLKEDIKKYQKQTREQKDNPGKVLELQKKIMDINLEYLTHSIKPTLITMLPILLVFTWLSGHYAYDSINPGEEFSIIAHMSNGVTGNAILEGPPELILDASEKIISSNEAVWKAKAKEGAYLLTLKTQGAEYQKEVIVSSQQKYATPDKKVADGVVESIEVPMKKLVFLDLFGWELGWVGTYILFSLVFSLTLRKLMDVQ